MKLSQSSLSSIPACAIRILIADRNCMGNQLLGESLGRDPEFDIVAAATPAEILSVGTKLQPDLALISADFDGAAKKGLQVARTLKSRNPSVGIVILLEGSTRDLYCRLSVGSQVPLSHFIGSVVSAGLKCATSSRDSRL